jgi:hypothetical protein
MPSAGGAPDRVRPGEAPVGEVREDAQVDPAAAPAGDMGGHRLRHGVDGVRPHGIAGVDDEVGHHHRAAQRVEHPHLDVAQAAAEAHQHGIAGIAQGAQGLLQDAQAGRVRVAHPDDLHLRDHQVAGDRGGEAVLIDLARGVADRGHHRGFLGRHRDQHVLAVDLHVGGDADGDVHRADDVLDQPVGELGGEVAELGEVGDLRPGQVGEGGHEVEALAGALGVEAGDARGAVRPGRGLHGSLLPVDRRGRSARAGAGAAASRGLLSASLPGPGP